jgi:hypothetical protein
MSKKITDISELIAKRLRISNRKITLLLFSKHVGGDAGGYGVAFFMRVMD